MRISRFPSHGWLGLLLVATMWPISWLHVQPIARHHFFFLWLGFILTTDALVLMRRGSSLLTRNRRVFAGLFLISLPAWWLFEFFNRFLNNWIYLGVEDYGAVQYFVLASISFSTVVPAVFEAAELMASFKFVERFKNGWQVPATRWVLAGAILFGLLSLVAMILWPRYTFPFAWTCVFFILDPLNYLMGWPSITAWVARGDWRPVAALWAGGLLCGFFWEMWNFYAWPKWIYDVPFVEFAHIFEMPILGYSGYFPFSLELFAIYGFAGGLANLEDERPYFRPWPDMAGLEKQASRRLRDAQVHSQREEMQS